MKTVFSRLSLDRPVPQHEQIRQYVHDCILSGELAVGQRLPSTEELAGLWKANVRTVHIALTQLARDGLLTRVNRVGTFVRKREAKLTSVGLYLTATIAESQYRQAVQVAVKEELQQAGIEADIWIDPRPDSQRAAPWMPLVRAAEHREFQALIAAGGGSLDRLRWLRKLPVPVTALGHIPGMSSRVELDHPQIADVSLRALAQQGCRSAGLILPIRTGDIKAEGSPNEWLELCRRFLELAGELQVTVKNEWVRLQRDDIDQDTARVHEQYGYEEFLKIWGQPERPAGLVVYDDTTARGVILGVREQHVRVPEDLKLVLHKNESVALFCPMPATFMVLSEREIARALVAQMQKQVRGETCEPITVGFTVSSEENASEQREQERNGDH